MDGRDEEWKLMTNKIEYMESYPWKGGGQLSRWGERIQGGGQLNFKGE